MAGDLKEIQAGLIEQYILDQTGKNKPNICFIPTATGDNEAYKVNYYTTFSKRIVIQFI